MIHLGPDSDGKRFRLDANGLVGPRNRVNANSRRISELRLR